MLDQAEQQRQEQLTRAIEFAGKYVRTFDPELMQHLYRTIVEHTLPTTATHAELAANNALRAFVVGIMRQIQLAQTGSPETPWPIQTSQQQPKIHKPRTRKPRTRKPRTSSTPRKAKAK